MEKYVISSTAVIPAKSCSTISQLYAGLLLMSIFLIFPLFLDIVNNNVSSISLFIYIYIYFIIIYFQNVYFFHAQLGLDIFPDMRPLHISLNTAHSGRKPS